MPVLARNWSRVSRITVLALLSLPLAAPAVVLGERTAAPGWQMVPSQASPQIRITGNRVTGLYPGMSKKMILTIRSSDRRDTIVVRRLRVRDVATANRGCAPTRRNLAVRQYKGAAIRLLPRGTRRVTVLLSMPKTVSDACQRAVFRLRYTALARISKNRNRFRTGP
jgi:hypothetical protein